MPSTWAIDLARRPFYTKNNHTTKVHVSMQTVPMHAHAVNPVVECEVNETKETLTQTTMGKYQREHAHHPLHSEMFNTA